ncbi:MAG: TIGR04255 family protein [Chlorobi bacterium]|nr:TIGR04255 family protein [Chlorobiota bacterium]MBX7217083.1 TIGR04255 family protein [Candidatus Kapabacteria bacterium]
MVQRLPKRISPCPIQEAVIELRFQTDMPADAVFGAIYQTVRDSYPQLKRLPLANIPEELRKEMQVQYEPLYHLVNPNFLCLIGPQVLSVEAQGEYPGWHRFKAEVLDTFNKVQNGAGVLKSITRIGMRYITVFDWNVLPELSVELKLAQRNLQYERMALQTYFMRDTFHCTVHLSNIEQSDDGGTKTRIDIDIAYIPTEDDTWLSIEQTIDAAHMIEKQEFFALLTPEFLETLHPEYEEEQ